MWLSNGAVKISWKRVLDLGLTFQHKVPQFCTKQPMPKTGKAPKNPWGPMICWSSKFSGSSVIGKNEDPSSKMSPAQKPSTTQKHTCYLSTTQDRGQQRGSFPGWIQHELSYGHSTHFTFGVTYRVNRFSSLRWLIGSLQWRALRSILRFAKESWLLSTMDWAELAEVTQQASYVNNSFSIGRLWKTPYPWWSLG